MVDNIWYLVGILCVIIAILVYKLVTKKLPEEKYLVWVKNVLIAVQKGLTVCTPEYHGIGGAIAILAFLTKEKSKSEAKAEFEEHLQKAGKYAFYLEKCKEVFEK